MDLSTHKFEIQRFSDNVLNKNLWRAVFFSVIVSSLAVLLAGDAFDIVQGAPYERFNNYTGQENVTVVTSQRTLQMGTEGGIYAFADEKLVYYNNSHDSYWDVDTVPSDNSSVVYLASDVLSKKECNATMSCINMSMVRLDLKTGEQKSVYHHINPIPRNEISRAQSARWHDADLIENGSKILVADIQEDRVFIEDISTNIIEWEWEAERDFPRNVGGGYYPKDWTHVNDVEMLSDGRIMVSLRNHDQVVFLDRQKGVLENWTLGEDENFDIINAQHNPDYIPKSEGGPAVVVADSGNDRAVEYQRVNGSWQKSWVWKDSKINWNRDVDRLPNGNTLITDTNGGRIIEIDRNGKIIRSFEVHLPYEAERLGTPDESGNGPSAVKADLKSRYFNKSDRKTGVNRAALVEKYTIELLPESVQDAIEFISPAWMGIYDLLAAVGTLTTLLIWIVLEIKWSRLRVRSPIY